MPNMISPRQSSPNKLIHLTFRGRLIIKSLPHLSRPSRSSPLLTTPSPTRPDPNPPDPTAPDRSLYNSHHSALSDLVIINPCHSFPILTNPDPSVSCHTEPDLAASHRTASHPTDPQRTTARHSLLSLTL
jgi:hypothetical protein